VAESPNLALPLLEAGQAQKHVTHNEALRLLDTLVQLAVLERGVDAPPGSPAEGERWIVGGSPTGAFSGHADEVAAWQDAAWQFSAPQPGWVAFVVDEATLYYWTGSSWDSLQSAITALQNLWLLGIGTSADAANPLAAKLNNILFTAKYASESGDGDLRCKLNKESAGDTVSQLYQTNYSGRAEAGLIGNDDFTFKVSPDGSTWHSGIVIDKDDGKVSFPSGISSANARERLAADRTYYWRSDGSDGNDGRSDSAGGAFLSAQKAMDVIATGLDTNGFNVTIKHGSETNKTFTAKLDVKPWVGGGDLTIEGNGTANTHISTNASATDAIVVWRGALPGKLTVKALKLSAAGSNSNGLFAQVPCSITLDGVEYGPCSVAQVAAGNGSNVYLATNYTISGGAASHIQSQIGGYIQSVGRTVTLSGTPNFGTAFALAQLGSTILNWSNTFSGSATGKRYSAVTNGLITTNGGGANYFPGNSAGTTATGGQYV
jgi:hypothetical protein